MNKLLIVAPHISPTRGFGGPSVSLRTFVDVLIAEGFKYIAITSAPWRFSFSRKNGSTELFCPTILGHRYGASVTGMVLIIFAVFFSKYVVINGLTCPFNFIAALICLLKPNVSVTLFTRGGLQASRINRYSAPKVLWYKLNIYILKKISKQSRLTVVFQSKPEELSSINLPFSKSLVIGNVTKSQFLKAHSMPYMERTTDILFVGRFSREKGIDRLMAFLHSIDNSNRCYNITLVFDSITQEQKKAVIRAAGTVNVEIFIGVDHSTLSEIYSSSRYLYFPSLVENYGNVIVEAVSHKVLPIVFTDTHWHALIDKGAYRESEFLLSSKSDLASSFTQRVNNVHLSVYSDFIHGNDYIDLLNDFNKRPDLSI